MAIAVVQTKSRITTGSASPTITLDAAPAAGNLLLVFHGQNSAQATQSAGPGTWSDGTAQSGGTGGSVQSGRAHWKISDGSEQTITITLAASSDIFIEVIELSGVDGTTPVIGNGSSRNASGTETLATAVTPTASKVAWGVHTIYLRTNSASEALSGETQTGTNSGAVVEQIDTPGNAAQLAAGGMWTAPISLTSGAYNGDVTPAVLGVNIRALVIVQAAAAGPINKTILPGTETDAAQPLAFTKAGISKAILPGTEADAAQPLAFVLGPSISKTIGVAAELDSAQPLAFQLQTPSAPIEKTILPATESDAAQPLSFVQQAITKTLGVGTEADTAQALAFSQAAILKTIGVASEADAAQVLSRTIGPAISKTLGPGNEADQAQALLRSQAAISKAIGAGVEADTALALAFELQVPVSDIEKAILPATETDTAMPLSFTQAAIQKTIGPATETDTARPIVGTVQPPITVSILPVGETDQALALAFNQAGILMAIGVAGETDSARPLHVEYGPPVVPGAARPVKWYISRPGFYG